MKKKEIIYILPVVSFFSKFSNVGGHIAHAYGVINGFREAGYKVKVICEENSKILDGIYESIDVIPRNNGFLNQFFWGGKVLRKINKSCSDSSFIYMRYSAGFSLWLLFIKFFISKPLVLEVNSIATQKYWWMKWLEKSSISRADVIVVVSDSLNKYLSEVFDENITNKIFVMTNGVDIKRFDNINRSNIPIIKPRSLGYVGVLKDGYDLNTLLKAFFLVEKFDPNVFLYICGKGPYEAELVRIIKGNKNIILLGEVPFLSVPSVMQKFHILIYTISNTNNFGSSTKLCEYMAAKKPIVATSTPHTQVLLGNEERGLLYKASDFESLAKKIIELLNSPSKGAFLANKAQKEVIAKHTWNIKIDSLINELDRRNFLN